MDPRPKRRLTTRAFVGAVVLLACGCGGEAVGSGGGTASTDVGGEPIDVSAVNSIEVGYGYCSPSAHGRCVSARSFLVNFDTSTLEQSGCSEGMFRTNLTTRALSGDEVRRVRDALAAIRTTSRPQTQIAPDKALFHLVIETPSGEALYSPNGTCSRQLFELAAGWDGLWNTVSSL